MTPQPIAPGLTDCTCTREGLYGAHARVGESYLAWPR